MKVAEKSKTHFLFKKYTGMKVYHELIVLRDLNVSKTGTKGIEDASRPHMNGGRNYRQN